jgi:uncharacterized protein YndB with AHSA1/START domain
MKSKSRAEDAEADPGGLPDGNRLLVAQRGVTKTPRERHDLMLDRISSESVQKATGRGWGEWLETLDAAGAVDWSHREIVAHLERDHPEVGSGWWRQSITVGYEQARGKRVIGQTTYAGFQVGVQRSIAATAAQAWELIVTRPELWLGEVAFDFHKGEHFEVPSRDGASAASGQIRVVKPGDRLRLTWQTEGWPEPATLQLTLSETASGRTTIHAHLEKLPDPDARERMRKRWREALERIAAAVP